MREREIGKTGTERHTQVKKIFRTIVFVFPCEWAVEQKRSTVNKLIHTKVGCMCFLVGSVKRLPTLRSEELDLSEGFLSALSAVSYEQRY